MGDLGTHAENLSEYITGLKIVELCADLTTFIKGRKLYDDGNVLLRFQKGARGILHVSQISIGEENNLAIWIYGEKGGLEWHQEHPNYLYVKTPDSPVQVWRRGNDYVADKVLSMRNGIERGDSLTRTAVATDMFTPLVLQMLNVGEETGAVDDMMDEVADFYEREVDYELKNISSAIEPILIVAVGILVLILALGIFLPMWDMTNVAKR